MTDYFVILIGAGCFLTGGIIGFLVCEYIWHHPKRDKLGRFTK